MFRCNPEHTGICETGDVRSQSKLLWKFRTNQLNRSTPVVANGMLYVGSNNGNLYALNALTGKLKWTFPTVGELSSSPATDGAVVYFNGGDGNFYAVDALTGARRWRFKAGKTVAFPDPYPWDFFQSSPVIVGDSVYFGSGDGNVYALNRLTGALQWRYLTGGRVRSSPAVSHGVVFVGSMDGNLYALDAGRGTLRWKFKTAGNPDFPLGEV
ncbi:MAG: PQQ-like beta-propeller repeat protein, partial [Candidatus Eremiobacteraeota bacterium]|nr:PQQ-like beta-propeller repeat protein [Candidatus Eremiobacteraeota bacterium]